MTMGRGSRFHSAAEVVMSEELSREDVHGAVDRAVEELLSEWGTAAPPVDAAALARRLGVAVRPPRPKKEFFARPEPTAEAKQWLAALAVGEHLKPALLRRLGFGPDERRPLMGESLATLAASHLLLPASWFADDARRLGYDVLELNQLYATAAPDVIAWRLLDLPEPCVVTVVDNDHVQRRRSNAWRVRRELAAPERECQRYVNHFSRPRVVCADGWTVQGWPVHQPDWKREILRSVVEAEPEN
jgi:hypothetical protein